MSKSPTLGRHREQAAANLVGFPLHVVQPVGLNHMVGGDLLERLAASDRLQDDTPQAVAFDKNLNPGLKDGIKT